MWPATKRAGGGHGAVGCLFEQLFDAQSTHMTPQAMPTCSQRVPTRSDAHTTGRRPPKPSAPLTRSFSPHPCPSQQARATNGGVGRHLATTLEAGDAGEPHTRVVVAPCRRYVGPCCLSVNGPATRERPSRRR
eukprot:22097-Prymnesium_polylepis.1